MRRRRVFLLGLSEREWEREWELSQVLNLKGESLICSYVLIVIV